MRKLTGSSAVPEPVVVCRRRSQPLLSDAVRLPMHATSTEQVVSHLSQGYTIISNHVYIVSTFRCILPRLSIAFLDYPVQDFVTTGCLKCCCKWARANGGYIRVPKVLCESLLVGLKTVSTRPSCAVQILPS
jgi:hypothetical protein